MQVIEHQHQLARMLADALHQGDDPMLDSHFAVVAAEQEAGIAHQLRVYFRKARLQAMGEALQFVVFGGER
ncbi:hypothetical protein D3C75_1102530 [compost metagenome]